MTDSTRVNLIIANVKKREDNEVSVNMKNRSFWLYIRKLSLLFVFTYSVVAVLFLYFQNILPEPQRMALDLYELFRSLDLMTLMNQLIRGIVIGIPEIFSKMLVFSVIFYFWEKQYKLNKPDQ